jgi:hypothetical protein
MKYTVGFRWESGLFINLNYREGHKNHQPLARHFDRANGHNSLMQVLTRKKSARQLY